MINLSKYKAFIFDMDGVIVNNHLHHLKAWSLFCNKYNFPINMDTFSQKYFGKSNSEILRDLSSDSLSEEKATLLGEEKEEIYRNLYSEEIVPHTGLVKLLRHLKSNQKLIAVASSAPTSNINFVLDTLNIRMYFDTIVDASMVQNSKPNPDIYIKVASILSVKPTECLVFEDSHSGIQSANKAGMDLVGIATTHTKEELNYNIEVISNFTELQFV